MIGSLYNGLSGLMSYQKAVDITGNNIANQGTIGFKYSRPTFSSIFNNADNKIMNSKYLNDDNEFLPYAKKGIGMGTTVGTIDRVMTDGVMENTGVFSDVAIGGSGFFFVGPKMEGDEVNPRDLYVSRVGNFQKNMIPDLIQAGTGMSLYGYMGSIKDGDIDIGMDDFPGYEEMINASKAEKLDFLKKLKPISLDELNVLPAKETKGFDISGILDTQAGPNTLISFKKTSNTGNPYTVKLEITRDFSMLDNPVDDDYEAYKLSFTVTDQNGDEIPDIDPVSREVLISPNGTLLTSKGNPMSNVSIKLPDASELNMDSSEISEEMDYTSPEIAAFGEFYDSEGVRENIPFTYEKLERNKWVMNPSKPVSGNVEEIRVLDENGDVVQNGGIEFSFNSSGDFDSMKLLDETGDVIPDVVPSKYQVTFSSGETQEIAINVDGLSELASPTTLAMQQTEGRVMGYLSDVSFSADGYLLGNYTNGVQENLAFIPLSRFKSSEVLSSSGGDPLLYNMPFVNAQDDQAEPETELSDNFFGYFKPGSGVAGSLMPNTLEYSNVDISKEMVRLIKYQRTIQLNSRVVQTADQILQLASQMKG